MDPLTILVDDSAFRYAVLMGIIETGADGALKAYAKTDNTNYLATTVVGYGSLLYVFQRALKNEKLGRVNAFWNAFTTISNVGMGMAMGETYTGKQMLGFGLISIGIFLI
jgi:multidrug transporter EmrE-like cation transporter